MSPTPGRFISVEGIDGAGKSTHVQWLAQQIRSLGHEIVLTREPGGTPLGEALRTLLLNHPMSADTEALLMFGARNENLEQVIRPALAAGRWVLSDRFTDASYAYQGAGKGVGPERLGALERWVQRGLQPDLTILFDLDVRVARERLRDAREPDKFERQDAAFFERARQGYLARAAADPARIKIVDASGSIEEIREKLEKYVSNI
ncbi:MAG: dTMP kinase [Burkholderiaceae bacterium]